MQKFSLSLSLSLLLILFVFSIAFIACDDGSSDGGSTVDKEPSFSIGEKVTYTANGVSFKMAYVPGELTFPIGTDDNAIATVDNAYWIGETETTYELWKKVHDWATDDARGSKKYQFGHDGQKGSVSDGTGMTVKHPVTEVSWRDSMVWCNALTEWYNAHKGTDYECVYTYSGAVIRDSRDTNAVACDGAVPGTAAKGFRLLTKDEWELAARYRGSDTTNVVTGEVAGVDFDAMEIKWTKGNSASGDTQAYDATPSTIGYYAVYEVNSGDKTAEVMSKGVNGANALGLYDMSGNVWEWTFDLYSNGTDRGMRGGSWENGAQNMLVGIWRNFSPEIKGDNKGFRFARSAD